jgi:hypothetical protein
MYKYYSTETDWIADCYRGVVYYHLLFALSDPQITMFPNGVCPGFEFELPEYIDFAQNQVGLAFKKSKRAVLVLPRKDETRELSWPLRHSCTNDSSCQRIFLVGNKG